MENSKKNKLLGLSLLSATLIGATAGIFLSKCYHEKKQLHPDDILEKVKLAFLEEGPIEGAWIEYTQQPLKKYALNYTTHTGGVTRKEGSKIVQYEFIADAKTGSILDIYQLT